MTQNETRKEETTAADHVSPRLSARREVAEKLIADLRRRLLDLRNNSRLLNFRFSDRARTHVRIIDELPHIIYGKLLDGRKLTFAALPEPEDEPEDERSDEFLLAFEAARMSDEEYLGALEQLREVEESSAQAQRIERALKDRVRQQLDWQPRPTRESLSPAEYARANGFDPSYDLPQSGGGEEHKDSHLNDFIQTLHFPDQMERKLSGIRDGARISLSEMGINVLSAAFGYLEWYESDNSDQRFFAPLLLHSLEMERTLIRRTYRYSISSTGDESEINLTLKERLLRDFGLMLPELGEEDTVESYLAKADDAIKERKRWRVRRFLTVGLFAFGRLAMYHDLDPKRWPNDKGLHLHPVLVELLGGSEESGALYAEDYEVDQPQIAAKVPLLITDADSSQFSAIADAMDGKNLAIKGPPGTGKSQTITNLIAAALAKGQKVLFVAEKMAALEVVKKRLDDAGLGEFCLELHSTKVRRKDVLESLQRRLELRPLRQPAKLNDAIEEHEQLRKRLTRYVELLNQPFGQSGKTLHDFFWAAARTGIRAKELGLPAALDGLVLERAQYLTAADRDACRGALIKLEEHVASLSSATPREHPWVGVNGAGLSPFEQQELIQALQEWHDELAALEIEAKQVEVGFGLSPPLNVSAVRRLAEVITVLPEAGDEIAADVLPKLTGDESLGALEKFLGELHHYVEVTRTLLADFDTLAERLPACETIRALEDERRKLTVGNRVFAERVEALPALAERYRSLARLAEVQTAVAKHLFEVAGVRVPLAKSSLTHLLDAISMLRSTPRHVLIKRRTALFNEASRQVLEHAAERALILKRHRKELAEIFVVGDDDNPEEYRACAASLRSAGLFARLFSRKFKRARRVWRGTRKIHSKKTVSEMARELEELVDYLVELRKFQENDRIRTICGAEFDGVATDFDGLLAVNDFARRVESCFPGPAPGNAEAQRFLRTADLANLDAVQAEAHDALVSGLRSFLSKLDADDTTAREDPELVTMVETSLGVAERAEQFHHMLKAAGLKDDVMTERLPELAEQLTLLAEIRGRLEGDLPGNHLLSEHFRGFDTDHERLSRTLRLARTLRGMALPRRWLDRLFADDLTNHLPGLKNLRNALIDRLERESRARDRARRAGNLNCDVFFGTDAPDSAPLANLTSCIQRALSATDELTTWLEYNGLRTDSESMGLKPITNIYEAADVSLKHLATAFDHAFHRTVLRQAYEQYPVLKRFSGTTQQAARRRFQELDRKLLSLKRQRLASELSRAEIPQGVNWGPRREWTDLHLINNEIGKQKRYIPLRDLLLRAGAAIQQMKLCWMMSPASVAQFVRPGGTQFDLVVIDEASQMRPEEAVGAIGRSHQLIVVGDPQQLPPTSFFERLGMPGEEEEEAEDYVESESILDLAVSVFHPSRELRWHYRSRNESLIAFSNKHFYEGKLVVFPSPIAQHVDYGVEYRKVAGLYTPRASVNVPEVQAVAQAAVEFMAVHSQRSLGVVTTNQAQREILSEEMDRLFAREPHAEAYRKRWEETLEPFFVKNLENVQGDERDVIFISTVYGPEQRGGRVAQRFGPINSASGHRRLNVLFTRAKEKVVVFSSMEPGDVIPTETSRAGVGILKHYLAYASSGQLDLGTPTGRPPDSDFEVFVADRLRTQGFEVVANLGVAGYFIDIAVKDPRDPGRYLLAVECDGATYHSAKSARDRDRLREEILVERGWEVYRIWSTDWFSNPEREAEKLLQHIRSLTRN